MQKLRLDRMLKLNRPRMQGNPGREPGRTPILYVTYNWVSARGQLQADLMFAPRLQVDADAVQRWLGIQPDEFQLSPQSTPIRLATGFHHVPQFILTYPVHVAAGRQAVSSCHDRLVNLDDRTRAELLIKAVGRFGRAGQDDDSRNNGIQPADDTQVDVSRFIVLGFDVLLGLFHQAGFGNPHRRQ